MVVELRFQYCREFFQDSFETHTEFEGKGEFQNHLFGWIRFENRFLKLLNSDDKNILQILQ